MSVDEDPETTIRGLIAAQLGTSVAAVGDEDRLQEDLGLDSTDGAELLVTLHQRHGLEIDIDELEGAATVADLVALARRSIGGGG